MDFIGNVTAPADDEVTDWRNWLENHTNSTTNLEDDFGLSRIATHLGKQTAVDVYWEGVEMEQEGKVDDAIKLYRRAYRIWPALDSITHGGLPRSVRDEAIAAGLTSGLLDPVDIGQARATKVMLSHRLLTTEDILAVEEVRLGVLSEQTVLENNPQNAGHVLKVGTFLNNPPSYTIVKDAPQVIGKMMRFAMQAWIEAGWSGDETTPGPLAAITGGMASLSIRVVERWQYEVGGGLCDPRHYDVDSILTVVALLSEESDYDGGVFRTFEPDDIHIEHPMSQGDVICFLSHKYHNITPVTRGVRRSLVMELWQGGIGHAGR